MDPQESFHCQSNGKACGPYTRGDMASYLAGGQLNPDDLVFDPTSNSWTPIGQFLSTPIAPFHLNTPFVAPSPSGMTIPGLPAQGQPIPSTLANSPHFTPMQPMPAEDNSKRTLAWVFGSLGVVAALIILIAIFTSSSDAEKLLKTHNRMAGIERSFIQRTKAAINGVNNDTIEMAAAASDAAIALRNLETSDCPEEYKIKLAQLAGTFDKIADAIHDDDLDAFQTLTDERLRIARQLNFIAKENGIQIEDGY